MTQQYIIAVLGRHAIPGSDGRCGPNNGPQCSDCCAGPLAEAPSPVTDPVQLQFALQQSFLKLVRHEFEPVDDTFLCVVCQFILFDPVRLDPCHHYVCSECAKLVENCPTCRGPIKPGGY